MFSRVTITKDGIDHYLGGDGGSNVLMLDGSTDQNCLTFDPVSERTSFWIVFEAAKKGTTDYVDAAVDPDYKNTKVRHSFSFPSHADYSMRYIFQHVIDGYATYYTVSTQYDRVCSSCAMSEDSMLLVPC